MSKLHIPFYCNIATLHLHLLPEGSEVTRLFGEWCFPLHIASPSSITRPACVFKQSGRAEGFGYWQWE